MSYNFYPQSATGLNYITYPAGPNADPTTITSSASTNTKGSYTQIAASTAFRCNWIIIQITRSTAAAGRQYLVDLATGGAGSESVLFSNLPSEGTTTNSSYPGNGVFIFPCDIAASTRLSARCQCSTGSQSLLIAVTLIAAGDVPGITSFVTYGANTTDSGGTSVDPGGTINTKGAYTEITSSTSAVAQWIMIAMTLGGNTAPFSATWAVDIATGAAGAETVLIPDLRFNDEAGAGNAHTALPRAFSMLTYIPASTRIAVRASCTINDATDRLLDIFIITGVAPTEPSSGGTLAATFA